jgi:hypothetical protein
VEKPDWDFVWEILEKSQWWVSFCNPEGGPPLTDDEKKTICGRILKDLVNYREVMGDEYYTELVFLISPKLSKMNWFTRVRGLILPLALWNYLFSTSKSLVERKMTGISDLDRMAKGLVKK